MIGSDGAPAELMWNAWNCFHYTHPNKFGLAVMEGRVDPELFKRAQGY